MSSVSGKHFPLFLKTSDLHLIFAPQYGITGFSESSLEQRGKVDWGLGGWGRNSTEFHAFVVSCFGTFGIGS